MRKFKKLKNITDKILNEIEEQKHNYSNEFSASDLYKRAGLDEVYDIIQSHTTDIYSKNVKRINIDNELRKIKEKINNKVDKHLANKTIPDVFIGQGVIEALNIVLHISCFET